jgi:hypothetical protein
MKGIQIFGKLLSKGPLVVLKQTEIHKGMLGQFDYLLLKYKAPVPNEMRKRLTIGKRRFRTLRKRRVFAQLRLEVVPDELFGRFLEDARGGEGGQILEAYRHGEQAMFLSYYEKVFRGNLAEGPKANRTATYTSSTRNVRSYAHGNFKLIPTADRKIFGYFLHPTAAKELKDFAEDFTKRLGFSVMILRAQNWVLPYKVYQDYFPLTPVRIEGKSCNEEPGPYVFKLLDGTTPPFDWSGLQSVCVSTSAIREDQTFQRSS